MKYQTRSFLFAGACALTLASTASHAVVVFDNMSAVLSASPGASATSTSSTPNTFMGDAYTLLAGTAQITGFDLFPVNQAGTTFTALKLNIYLWGGVNTGTINAANPAFSNLLGSYSVTSTGTYTTGFFYPFQDSSAPGVLPGISLATPVSVPGTAVGVTINAQGSTDGVTYTNVNSLTSVISYGVAPTVGSLTLGGTTGGYFRNGNGEVNGNFTSGVRTLGFTYQGIGLRLYGNVTPVPEVSTWLMMGLGLSAIGLLALRRQQR